MLLYFEDTAFEQLHVAAACLRRVHSLPRPPDPCSCTSPQQCGTPFMHD